MDHSCIKNSSKNVRFLSQLTKADYKVCQAKLYMNRLKKADNKPKKNWSIIYAVRDNSTDTKIICN